MDSEATTQPLPVFVYGTLMIGQPNDYMWQDCIQRVESAYVDDCLLYDLGHYPVMVKKVGGRVVGQLVHLEKACFTQIIQNLDYLEGYDPNHPGDSNFLRVQVQVSKQDRECTEAWVYVGVGSYVQNLPLIEHGDWARHIAERDNKNADW